MFSLGQILIRPEEIEEEKIGCKNLLSQKKKLGPEKVLAQKQILGPKNWRSKKLFGKKKLVKTIFG